MQILKLKSIVPLSKILFLLVVISNCFILPGSTAKSQSHKLMETCLINLPGCNLSSQSGEIITGPYLNIQESGTSYGNNSIYNFGIRFTSDVALVKTFTIQNIGTETLTLTSVPIVIISGIDAGDFLVDLEPEVSELLAGESTDFSISFKPKTIKEKSAQFTIESTDPNKNPYTVNLKGEGIAGL